MDTRKRLTPRERIVRIGIGVLLIVVGCMIFALSHEHDPDNKWAAAGILALIVGASWAGPGIRGHREGASPASTWVTGGESPLAEAAREAPTFGPPISAERTVLGVLLAWAVPGLGHWIIGRRSKAILYFVTITACFFGGVLLAEGRNLDFEENAFYFAAYIFNAGEMLLGVVATRHLELDHEIPLLQVGLLYSAVAALLNLVAMMDFVATCGRGALPETGTPPGTPRSVDLDGGDDGDAATDAGWGEGDERSRR